jgi:serine phosphatase RsbU (regulator of sigma subunit)
MHSLFQSPDAIPAPAPAEPVPTVFPKIEGAEIAAQFIGKRVAGDFYDSLRVGPERILFGLLDVAGLRPDNRAVLATAQQIFRNVGTELFAPADLNESDAMTQLCLSINRGLIDACKGVHSCPAFIACYHEQFGTLCYTNAGHTPALLRDHTGIAELGSTGLPLGLFSHATCEAPTVGMEKNAALFLVSRGVVTCQGHHESSTEEFSLDRVKQLFQAAAACGAADVCSSILNAADTFGGKIDQCDDRTALALLRTA